MKEFIEKLISKIEKETYNMEICEEQFDMNKPYFIDVPYKMVKFHDIKEIINELAEEYNNGWIPCSERLPERDMWCLATFESGGIDKIQYLFLQRWWNGEMGGNRVVAWQPLPAPYEENRDGKI